MNNCKKVNKILNNKEKVLDEEEEEDLDDEYLDETDDENKYDD